MIIGVPKEIKRHEYRVAITPMGVSLLVKDGHKVLVEKNAGLASGFKNKDYEKSGAKITDKREIFEKSDLIIKVKEPLPEEYSLFRERQAIFTYLHLASNQGLIEFLCENKITSFAYETLEINGTLPLLTPMSEIAGKMAPIIGAFYLQKKEGGNGILPIGTVGVESGKLLVLGAGNVGFNSARVGYNMGFDVVVLNRGFDRLHKIDEIFNGKIKTKLLNSYNIEQELYDADVIIGAILIPGGRTPMLITKDMLKRMKKGSVIVDVSIDQGGCVETAKPTTHDKPVYKVNGIIHYMVANMPGAYPRTSTIALTNATIHYIREIANKGIEESTKDKILKTALNIYNGEIVHENLRKSLLDR